MFFHILFFFIFSFINIIIIIMNSSIMNLVFFEDDQTFVNLEELILRVNEHAKSQEYVVVLLRIKKSKLEVKRKAWLICDRDRKFDDLEDQHRRHTESKRVECSFFLIEKRLDDNDDSWSLKVINSQHNHASTLVDAHSVHRRMILIVEIKSDINRQLTVQIASAQMLFSLRISDSATSANLSNSENSTIVPLLKFRDIYNIKAQLRRDVLESLTSMQTLIRQLNESDWIYQLQKNSNNQITHLFFIRGSSQTILKNNYEILMLDCTYKINRYKMSLLMISEQIEMSKNFYVRFCFMTKEITSNYCWILNQLKTVYAQMKMSKLTIIVTDMKKELIVAMKIELSEVHHLFCTWHINNNILANCKRSFRTKETWDLFFSNWKTMMYASSKTKFWSN